MGEEGVVLYCIYVTMERLIIFSHNSQGLVIGGAAAIPTNVLLLKKAALVKGVVLASVLASQDENNSSRNRGR